MTVLVMTALHLRIADYWTAKLFLESIFKRNSPYPMLGIKLKSVTYKMMVNSLHIQEIVTRRQQ